MRDLLYKELRLCMQPLTIIFFSFVLMLLIPSYMYLVPAFFTTNAIFNLFQRAVTNNDLSFTVMLPVCKRDAVRGRFLFVALIELVMVLLYIPMIALNNAVAPQPNTLFCACPALIGGVFITFAVFNAVFMPSFYKTGYKTGKSFVLSSIAVFVWIFAFEAFFMTAKALSDRSEFFSRITHLLNGIPQDKESIIWQIAFIAFGAIVYAAATFISCRVSEKRLEKVDL